MCTYTTHLYMNGYIYIYSIVPTIPPLTLSPKLNAPPLFLMTPPVQETGFSTSIANIDTET